MGDEVARDRQLALLVSVMARSDLSRGEVVNFIGMRFAVTQRGVILTEAQESWLRTVNSRPMPDLTKVEAWRTLQPERFILWRWILGVVVVLVVFQNLLTFLLHWLGWR